MKLSIFIIYSLYIHDYILCLSAFQIIFHPKYDEKYDFRDTITRGFDNPFVEVTMSQEGENIILSDIDWVSGTEDYFDL